MYKLINTTFILFSFLFITSCNSEEKKVDDKPSTKKLNYIDELNNKLVADPNNGNLYLERSNYFLEKELYEKAMDDISRAISTDSLNPEFIYAKGNIFFSVMRFDEATIQFAKCLKIDKSHANANLKMARILVHLQQYPAAIKHIDFALKKNVNLAEAYLLKGIVFQFSGDSTAAASSFQTAVEQKGDYYDAYILLGLLYASRNDSLAIEYYNSALSLKPSSSEALYNLAIYYQNSKRFTNAFRTYNKLNLLHPDNEGAYHNKGYMYLVYLNEKEKAIQQFDSALRINPKYLEAFHNRGLAYRELKKFKEARADFKSALEINPQYELSANELDDMDRKREK